MKVLKAKTKAFAIRILKLSKVLQKEKRHNDLIERTVIAGTSIGAEVVRAECSPDKEDFLQTILLASKEANEAIYGINALFKASLISKDSFDSLIKDAVEIQERLDKIAAYLDKNKNG
jgi:four helix bundle protein